ncbi:MAG: hypothetical protein SW833_08515 [Cyanobacteriota bacterium]|nr:hypothetical protein [Cyanobacteriota bacterium]
MSKFGAIALMLDYRCESWTFFRLCGASASFATLPALGTWQLSSAMVERSRARR